MSKSISTARICGYALGEGATSITINGISNFGLLFYTQVLGMSSVAAGLALSLSLVFDAITDPIMGHITDNTRSRFGRRLPYIVSGGLALALAYLLVWMLPSKSMGPVIMFAVVLATNLGLRLAITVYGIPYTAFGFELCPEYEDRSRLQGIRMAFNQGANLLFGAFAWSIFFRDGTSVDGSRLDGTLITQNYLFMGMVLSVVSLVLVVLCVFSTRSSALDNRMSKMEGNSLGAFWRDLWKIVSDRTAWYVFGFFSVAQFAMLLVSQVQMFTYVFFMEFPADVKTVVHGAGMVAFALGALLQTWLARQFDKKPTGYIGMISCAVGGMGLFAVFIVCGLEPKAQLSIAGYLVPVGTILFALGQALWWGGCGILTPLAMSMVADISEINFLKTGVLKDGSYSAVFTFILKACMSLGLLITGWMVSTSGIVSGAATQAADATFRIATITFLSGPILIVASYLILRKYPVDRFYLKGLKGGTVAQGLVGILLLFGDFWKA